MESKEENQKKTKLGDEIGDEKRVIITSEIGKVLPDDLDLREMSKSIGSEGFDPLQFREADQELPSASRRSETEEYWSCSETKPPLQGTPTRLRGTRRTGCAVD